jgi:hypothetical protein
MPMFSIVSTPPGQPPEHRGSLHTVWQEDGLSVGVPANAVPVILTNGDLYVFGRVDARRSANGALGAVESLDGVFSDLARHHPFEAWAEQLEGRFILVLLDRHEHRCLVQADRFGRADVFVQQQGGVAAVASGLPLLPSPLAAGGYDQAAIAHALTIYSVRPPKQHTIFKNVRRAGVGDTVVVSARGVETRRRRFVPAETRPHGPRDLVRYTDLFLEALRARGSDHGNVVYLSSGWDSTSILAGLVHVFGARKVRCVIGRMTYSTEAGVCNPYEIARAAKVADYFGVPLETVEFDYTTTGRELFDDLRPIFQSAGFVGPTSFNHWKLARFVADTSAGGESVFAGEISDGAHNLGFSQYLTVFHPVIDFREYSDKMLGYLFGPTFLKALWDGSATDDPVYRFLRDRYPTDTAFDDVPGGRESRTTRLLSSFFLRGVRFPLWSLRNSRMLTADGRRAYLDEMERTYLAEAGEAATPSTLYAWYLHLYNSFHWQAGTVATLDLTADACGLPMALPFWDAGLQDFLSGMPEDWGRGLELKPTKYPLKEMLASRIDYPMHLQVGPHSYQYDVNPRFTLTGESMHRSQLGAYFKTVLARGDCFAHLSPEMFEVGYLRGLVERFAGGEELYGADLSDVAALSYFAAYLACV